MRGYSAQDAEPGHKEWKDAVQRVAHRMRVTIHRKKYLAASPVGIVKQIESRGPGCFSS